MVQSPATRREALLKRFPSWDPTTLHQWFDRLSEEFFDQPVLLTEHVEWSYGQVQKSSVDLAAGLAELGVGHGDRVAMVMANYPEFLPLKIAISRVGAIAVPLNYLYREAELEYVLRQSRAHYLISMSEFSGLDYVSMFDAIAPGWSDGNQSALPDLRKVVLYPTGDAKRAGVMTLDELKSLGSVDQQRTLPPVSPDDISDLIYTSGTTGSPKGVLMTHDGILRSSFGSALTKALGKEWRALFSMPMYHMFAYTEALLPSLWVGGSVVPRLEFKPDDYLAGIERFKATEILAVPTMTVAILEAAERGSYDLSSLVSVMSAAAAAPAWVWQRVKELLGNPDIVTGWGMTETSAGIALTRPEDPIHVQSTTVGAIKDAGSAAMPGNDGLLFRVAAIDPVSGERLPAGEAGELVVSSPCVMVGFWEKPEETNAVLKGGWLHTGDMGFIDPDGRVVLTGRAKELYKSGGELVMPKEVEDFLTRLPGVSQAYAIGIPDELWGERGCAVIVPEPDVTLSSDEILGACRQGLARFKIPKEIVFLKAEELPTTPTGKIQKFRLVEMLTNERQATR